MGHAPLIALDGDFLLKPRQGSGSVDLGQRPIDKPPSHGANCSNEKGNNPQKDSKKGSQVYSHAALAKIQCRGRTTAAQPLCSMDLLVPRLKPHGLTPHSAGNDQTCPAAVLLQCRKECNRPCSRCV